jgi:cytochrome b
MMPAAAKPLHATPEAAAVEVPVWDRFVRVFHWSLLALFVLCCATAGSWAQLHGVAGLAVAALLAARVVWGVLGPRHARFADFVRGPRSVLRYLRDSLLLRAPRYLGHNPAGGAMVLALITTLTVICATGVMMGTEALRDLAWVKNLHVVATRLTLGLAVLHVGGVALASFTHGENLVKAMITGRKRA